MDLDRRISEEAGELSSVSISRSHGSHARHFAAVRGYPCRSGANPRARSCGLRRSSCACWRRVPSLPAICPSGAPRSNSMPPPKNGRTDPPFVNSAKVKRAAKTSELLLPGNITPITEAYIFARASGYLKRRYVDIGDRVRADQLLAEIDAPDLDQQVSQARAAVAQAESQLGQARSDAAATHRYPRSCRHHLAEIQGAYRVGSRIPPGWRHAIDGSQDSRSKCRRRRESRCTPRRNLFAPARPSCRGW